MDYFNIVSRSFVIVKKNRPLWVFGMVLAAFTGGTGFNGFKGGGGSPKNLENLFKDRKIPEDAPEKISRVLGSAVSDPAQLIKNIFGPIPPLFWICLVLGILALICFGILLRIYLINWALGAIYNSVAKGEQGEHIKLETGSDYGRHSYRRLIYLSVILWGGYFLAVLTGTFFSVIGFLLFPGMAKLIPLLFSLLFLLAAIITAIYLSIVNLYANLAVTIEDYSTRKALSFGFNLTKKFFWQGIVMALLNQGIGCLYGCLSCTAIFLVCLILLPVIFLLLIIPIIGIGIAVFLIGLFIVALSFLILVTGIVKAVTSTNWVLFYLELKKDQKFPGQNNLLSNNSNQPIINRDAGE